MYAGSSPAESRPLAQEWTYRFLSAALTELGDRAASTGPADLLAAGTAPPLEVDLPAVPPLRAEPAPDTAAVRSWAIAAGPAVATRGRIAGTVLRAYRERHSG